jgi:hypothetical protein
VVHEVLGIFFGDEFHAFVVIELVEQSLASAFSWRTRISGLKDFGACILGVAEVSVFGVAIAEDAEDYALRALDGVSVA